MDIYIDQFSENYFDVREVPDMVVSKGSDNTFLFYIIRSHWRAIC